MQFKTVAVLLGLTATGAIASPMAQPDAGIHARADQAEAADQAKQGQQGKQDWPFDNNGPGFGLNNFNGPGLGLNGLGGGPNNFFPNQFNNPNQFFPNQFNNPSQFFPNQFNNPNQFFPNRLGTQFGINGLGFPNNNFNGLGNGFGPQRQFSNGAFQNQFSNDASQASGQAGQWNQGQF